jgi:hypothetical protein
MMNEPTTLTSQTDASGVIVLQFHGDLDSMGTHTVETQFDAALAGFHELFNIYPTVDEAVASLEPSVDR